MDGITAVGLAGNILQFIEFGGQVVTRLQEFCSNTRDVPQTFREVTNSLPLLLRSLEHIQEDLKNGEVDQKTEAALAPVVKDFKEQIESLNQILEGTLPAPGDSQWKTATKALTSFWHDKKIQKIRSTINHYQGPLLLYQTRRSSTLEHQRLPSVSGDSSYLDKDIAVLPTDRTREQVIPYSPSVTPTPTTSSFDYSPTGKSFELRWSETNSSAGTAVTSPNPAPSGLEPRRNKPTAVERPSSGTSLILAEPAIGPLQQTIGAKIIYTPEGGTSRSVEFRLEFGRTKNGQGNVTSVIWTRTSGHPWGCHSLSESESQYPHTEHPEGDSPSDHIVSFLGRQVLWEESQSAAQVQDAPESLSLARIRASASDPIFTGTIDYLFNSPQDLINFRQIVFGKKLVICIPINRISLSTIECETETLSLWESFGVRTVAYFASAASRKHVHLEVVSSDALEKYSKSSLMLTLRVKPNIVQQGANSVSSNSSSWSFSSKSKDKSYIGLKITFGSLEDRNLFADKISNQRPPSSP